MNSASVQEGAAGAAVHQPHQPGGAQVRTTQVHLRECPASPTGTEIGDVLSLS
jgi:hypothetical protein